MNNKLSENLKKIRKDNNLSQEQLAEELGVSRQAISKWESAAAYPEMDKIIQLCDKFDLNIDDLLHKDIKDVKDEKNSKNNLNKYIDSFLNFITDTISLFSNMKIKSKIKCIFEQIVIIIVLSLLFLIIGALGYNIFYSLLDSFLPFNIYSIILNVFKSIYLIMTFLISLIIIIHIFKTRYLNYYKDIKIKNKDDNVLEKTEVKEEKIIIRDPKHSEYKFLNGLFKIFIYIVKFIAIIIMISFITLLISLLTLSILSFVIIKTGVFFVGILFSLLSASVINIVIILLLINFVFNRKNDKKKMIWTFIVFIIIFGIGCGLICVGTLKFDLIDRNDSDIIVNKTLEIDMNDKLFFDEYNNIEYIEKNINNIEIEYKINKMCNIDYYHNNYQIVFNSYCSNPFKMIREFINQLNNNKIITIDNEISDIKVYASSDNINKIKNNLDTYIKEQNSNIETITSLENQIDEYENELIEKDDKIEEYKNTINELKEEIEYLNSDE